MMIELALTDHVEGPLTARSAEVYDEVIELVQLADQLGMQYAWFAEHHGHLHGGHLSAPLLMALHLMGLTRQIRLGTAIICVNLHHPLEIAEQVAVADVLTGGRLAPGFGSGSTDAECKLFGIDPLNEEQRHVHFEQALWRIRSAWEGVGPASERLLPLPREDLAKRSWIAVNSAGAAQIAGRLGWNVLFSHLRTPEQYRELSRLYRAAGGSGRIAANRPVFVGADEKSAWRQAEPALRILWRRFQQEGKIDSDLAEPSHPAGLCVHPINFIVGGPESVARQLRALYEQCPFDVLNVEFRWAGLSHELICQSLRRLVTIDIPHLM